MTPDDTSRDIDYLESEVAQLKSALAGIGQHAVPQSPRLSLVKMWAAGMDLNPFRKSYHLPGEHDQCDHSITGECTSDPSDPRAAMFKNEREIAKNKRTESGAFYDSSGAFLGSLKGGKDKITICFL